VSSPVARILVNETGNSSVFAGQQIDNEKVGCFKNTYAFS
jgi:hypothetical protein